MNSKIGTNNYLSGFLNTFSNIVNSKTCFKSLNGTLLDKCFQVNLNLSVKLVQLKQNSVIVTKS